MAVVSAEFIGSIFVSIRRVVILNTGLISSLDNFSGLPTALELLDAGRVPPGLY